MSLNSKSCKPKRVFIPASFRYAVCVETRKKIFTNAKNLYYFQVNYENYLFVKTRIATAVR